MITLLELSNVLSLEHQNKDRSSPSCSSGYFYTVNWISPSSEQGLEILELNQDKWPIIYLVKTKDFKLDFLQWHTRSEL